MKQRQNLIIILLVAALLLTACGDNDINELPTTGSNDAERLEKGKAGEAMLDHFRENKEVQVGIYLQPLMLDRHQEFRFVPDLIDNKPNMDMNLEIVMPEYDMAGVAAIGYVYVGAGDIGRLSTDSKFLAKKMMESDDVLYVITSNKYIDTVNGFTISSEKAKAILNMWDIAALAIKEGKVVTK